MINNTDIAEFGRSLYTQGRTYETIRQYQGKLREFLLFADKFDEYNIYKFKDYLSKRYSAMTVKCYLSVLSQFCKHKGIDIDFRNFTVYYAEKEEEKNSKDDKYKLPPMMKTIVMNKWLEKIRDAYDVGDKIKCRTLEIGVLTEGTIIYKSDYFISAELKIGYRMSFTWHDVAMGKIVHIN